MKDPTENKVKYIHMPVLKFIIIKLCVICEKKPTHNNFAIIITFGYKSAYEHSEISVHYFKNSLNKMFLCPFTNQFSYNHKNQPTD